MRRPVDAEVPHQPSELWLRHCDTLSTEQRGCLSALVNRFDYLVTLLISAQGCDWIECDRDDKVPRRGLGTVPRPIGRIDVPKTRRPKNLQIDPTE